MHRTTHPRRARLRAGLVAAVAAVGLAATACAGAPGTPAPPDTPAGNPAAGSDANAVLSPIAFFPLAAADPVLGADDQQHLAYELVAMNQSPATVTITKLETLDGDTVLGTLEGAALTTVTRISGGAPGPAFAPGGSGYLFMDVSLPAAAAVPATVTHRFTMSVESPGKPAAPLTVTGVPETVHPQPAVVLAPPLKGDGWIVGSGCCATANPHRGATLSIDGTVHVAERFAIDFIQLEPSRHLYTGDPTKNESWLFFGAEVYSAAAGTVVRVQDGLPENVPGALPPGATAQTAGGNYIVVDIGNGRFAFYAHLQPGSLKVKVGDKVDTGTVLGLLGNTGNSDAPHLHFHVMDGPSPLLSNGLPFRFTDFTGQGRVTDAAGFEAPFPNVAIPVDTSVLAGAHHEQLPLDFDVVGFK